VALFRCKPKGDVPGPPPAPPGYEAVHNDEIDRWLAPLCEKVFASLTEQEVPPSLSLAFMQPAVTRIEGASGDVVRYVATACALGYYAREVEFDSLSLEKHNPDITGFLSWAASAHSFGEDWFATMNGVADTLANASESTATPTEETIALLAPEGMGTDARRRFARHQLLALANSDEPAPSGVTTSVLVHSWRVGYYLHACKAALPDEALDDLNR
jgi:hypothetical protein